jgi:hypothetical protein
MRATISKSDWLSARKCSAQGWYALRAELTAPDEAGHFRMQQGQEIGVLARKLYPGGVLVSRTNGKSPAQLTQERIADRTKPALFEATAVAGPFVAKADILHRHNGGWHLFEVKSKFPGKDNDELVDDLAYTAMVFKRAGLPVTRASVVLLSRAYRFGQGPERLFEIIDCTTDVLARAVEFDGTADDFASVLLREVPPAPLLVPACRDCSFFRDRCLGAGLQHTVLEIPGLHFRKLQRLSAEGAIEPWRIPDDIGLSDRQERVKSCIISGEPFVDPALRGALGAICWPCYYLDFETVSTFLPLYDEHGCHEQVLTQFSVDLREAIEAAPQHCEYLADPSRDCQRELAEALISAVGQTGSIIVYSSFERTRISALQTLFPDLAARLGTLLERLVDLRSLIEKYVYHPEFKGSYSIKATLPALVPDLSYKDLAIDDGEIAVTRFARMARGEVSGSDAQLIRQQLLEYCRMDTLAMLRLHGSLCKMAS